MDEACSRRLSLVGMHVSKACKRWIVSSRARLEYLA
jgi:hypothetical protein